MSHFKRFNVKKAKRLNYFTRSGRVKLKHDIDESRAGYIYIIDLGQGLYKVGKTVNFDRRLKDLQTGNPDAKAVLVERVIDRHAVEQAIQVLLKKSHQGREVFTLNEGSINRVRKVISQFQSQYPISDEIES